MGIYDRDYMKRDDKSGRAFPLKWVAIGGSVAVALLFLASYQSDRRKEQPKTAVKREQRSQTHSPVDSAVDQRPVDAVSPSGPAQEEPTTLSKGALRVNVNTASQPQLESIPGIGPVKAKLIIDNRPYSSVEDLAKLKLLGAKSVENVRPYVKTDGVHEKITSK